MRKTRRNGKNNIKDNNRRMKPKVKDRIITQQNKRGIVYNVTECGCWITTKEGIEFVKFPEIKDVVLKSMAYAF